MKECKHLKEIHIYSNRILTKTKLEKKVLLNLFKEIIICSLPVYNRNEWHMIKNYIQKHNPTLHDCLDINLVLILYSLIWRKILFSVSVLHFWKGGPIWLCLGAIPACGIKGHSKQCLWDQGVSKDQNGLAPSSLTFSPILLLLQFYTIVGFFCCCCCLQFYTLGDFYSIRKYIIMHNTYNL